MLELLLLCSVCLPLPPNAAALEESRPKQHFYHLDKGVLLLAGAQTGMVILDGITTERSLKRPQYDPIKHTLLLPVQESSPIARALLGPYPTWQRMIPLGAAEVAGSAYLAQYLKSRHSKLWWLPQVSFSVVHGTSGSLNIRVSRNTQQFYAQ